MKQQQPLSAESEAMIRDHVAVNRLALRKAVDTTVRQCRGLLMSDVGVGMDPGVDDPMRRWWAKVRLQGGRAGVDVIAEGCGSALDALEALQPKIRHHVLSRKRGR